MTWDDAMDAMASCNGDLDDCRRCGLLGLRCFPPVTPTADERRAVELLVGGLAGRSFSDLRAAVDRLGPAAMLGGPGMWEAVAATLSEAGREERARARRCAASSTSTL